MTQALWKGCETPHDVYLAVLPVYHMFGESLSLPFHAPSSFHTPRPFHIRFMEASAHSLTQPSPFAGLAIQLHYPFRRSKPVVMVNTGFSVPSFCKAVERYAVTSVLVVPPIILDLSESTGECCSFVALLGGVYCIPTLCLGRDALVSFAF
jgi:4-coumarate--CoA ligase